MKFTVFALVAALCLVAVSANTVNVEPIEEFDYEFEAQQSDVEIESYGAFSGIYWVFKKTLKTLKGINCSIQGVMDVKAAAQQFIDDVQGCGTAVSKQVQNVINSMQDIISTSNDIINLNENVCNNGDYNEETDANTKSSSSCFWKLLKKLMLLKKQIKNAISLIQKVPTVGPNASDCVNTAMTDVQTAFNAFPSFVKTCSQLTN